MLLGLGLGPHWPRLKGAGRHWCKGTGEDRAGVLRAVCSWTQRAGLRLSVVRGVSNVRARLTASKRLAAGCLAKSRRAASLRNPSGSRSMVSTSHDSRYLEPKALWTSPLMTAVYSPTVSFSIWTLRQKVCLCTPALVGSSANVSRAFQISSTGDLSSIPSSSRMSCSLSLILSKTKTECSRPDSEDK
ncbi:unnamed protein product [Echinostoma caproni]|uniref:Secreted protein n=1 Tax=Echinostoma caproni TaxID=27848 RepID=A0A183ALA0_9TREM|nr:unnamed protein product [Echinostoma caproni]